MKEYFLKEEDLDSEKLLGTFAKTADFCQTFESGSKVYKPDGSLLFCLVESGISEQSSINAIPFIRKCNDPVSNRGMAAGIKSTNVKHQAQTKTINGKQYKSKTLQFPSTVSKNLGCSASVGFYDRYPRMPFCRICRHTESHPKLWQNFLPLTRECSKVFENHVPALFKKQKHFIENTESCWVIPETVFTTCTINIDFRTAYHRDKGDLECGFGVITTIYDGFVSGGFLVFPRYKAAVKLKHRDVLLFDPHEIHGNTAIAKGSTASRYSVVLYYRENMAMCKTNSLELDRAKRFTQIRQMYSDDEVSKLKILRSQAKLIGTEGDRD